MSNPVINSIGILISIEVGLDISGATQLDIRYIKPDKTIGKWQLTDGVNYVFDDPKHLVQITTTTTSQIDEAGYWTFQVYAVAAGYELYGAKVRAKFDMQIPES